MEELSGRGAACACGIALVLHLQPSECMIVEDALAGIDATVAGGFRSAGIGEAAAHAQVTFPIQKVSDILAIL